MTTRIILRTCPGREEFADYLKAALPDAEFLKDQRQNPGLSFIGAMRAAGPDAVLHMEDDVILTSNFREKVEAVIAKLPKTMIQFFGIRGADLTVGSRWDTRFLWTQCFYMPPGWSAEIVRYFPTWRGDKLHNYDSMVGHWLNENRLRYWIHVPSLVQHREAKSAIDPRRSSKRQSKTFVP